ncbi:hypothetical protein MSHOH_3922 [Methanosarcina horonobensis HB-1 = JCM 15518]|uniref:Uncharacterized protein n=1 Tax=Methanosarcina horonobensis HB-1 = JCM 15518 TaxID=1434110 RepID=A0A0E3WVC9_9EURY|nr:hypothetical protein MSHOH_3922 [Methanosarcina horonobensis HB-1 = JCM 15518]
MFSPCHVDQGLVGILWDLKATEKGELYNFPVSKPYLVEIVREFKILDFFILFQLILDIIKIEEIRNRRD